MAGCDLDDLALNPRVAGWCDFAPNLQLVYIPHTEYNPLGCRHRASVHRLIDQAVLTQAYRERT